MLFQFVRGRYLETFQHDSREVGRNYRVAITLRSILRTSYDENTTCELKTKFFFSYDTLVVVLVNKVGAFTDETQVLA